MVTMADTKAAAVSTPLYQLVETKLGLPLGRFLVDRYEGNPHIHTRRQEVFPAGNCSDKHAHRKTAQELWDLTSVDATHEAVRQWYRIVSGKQTTE
jgi:hypothetical protein